MTEPTLVCLIGAECTGKTTLAHALAGHFSGSQVPEHLRTFCDVRGRTPIASEQSEILEAQVFHEAQTLALARHEGFRYIFCDTAPLLTAIYSEFFFADRSLYERAHALHARYGLTLLLEPDLPWISDRFHRDGPVVRDQVHALIARELAVHSRVIRICGSGPSRLQAAIAAVECQS